ncbi:MAG: 2-C-methyl-D-erythritol 4-phosphate cytidylyltransferase [Nocardioides sp.]|uniref:2-C-methyl-D-erythritol 4-phosphate cytidylyltransferase n=1 Tax=Nocardioides sp. TaxID=35761 RepID=UPI003F0C337F
MSDFEDEPIVLGSVVDAGRGALPYGLIHGESLVACAAWALGQAGVRTIDVDSAWDEVRESGWPLVLHDALCPMTPAEFVTACLELAAEEDAVVVGVRPVTDTVKVVTDGLVGESVDRDRLWAVCSPVVLPADVVASMDAAPGADLAALVAGLAAAGHTVRTLTAPPEGRRVTSADEVRLLEELTVAERPERDLLGH